MLLLFQVEEGTTLGCCEKKKNPKIAKNCQKLPNIVKNQNFHSLFRFGRLVQLNLMVGKYKYIIAVIDIET